MKDILWYISIIILIITGICVFLPWLHVSGSVSVFSFDTDFDINTVNGIALPGGIMSIVVSIAGIILAYKKIIWSVIPGIINIMIALGYCFGWFKQGVSFKGSIGEAGLIFSPSFGLIIFLIGSILFVIIILLAILQRRKQ